MNVLYKNVQRQGKMKDSSCSLVFSCRNRWIAEPVLFHSVNLPNTLYPVTICEKPPAYSFISVPKVNVPGDDSCGCVVSTVCQDVRCVSAGTAGTILNDSAMTGDTRWVQCIRCVHIFYTPGFWLSTSRKFCKMASVPKANYVARTWWCVKCRSKHVRLIHCTLKWDHSLTSQHYWSSAYVVLWTLASLSGILTSFISPPWSNSFMLVILERQSDISQFLLWEMAFQIWAEFSLAHCKQRPGLFTTQTKFISRLLLVVANWLIVKEQITDILVLIFKSKSKNKNLSA